MGALVKATLFLIDVLFSLYILAVLLRFLFQVVRADFYNPFSQALVRITNPTVITSYSIHYTKLYDAPATLTHMGMVVLSIVTRHRITSYNVCYTKLLRACLPAVAALL